MFGFLEKLISKTSPKDLTYSLLKEKVMRKNLREELINLLKVSPEYLALFEEKYSNYLLYSESEKDLFGVSAKQMVENMSLTTTNSTNESTSLVSDIKEKILEELIDLTQYFVYDGEKITYFDAPCKKNQLVSKEKILATPKELRPDFTGYLMRTDLNGPSYPLVLGNYLLYLKETNPKKKKFLYSHYRQGLEIVDIDNIIYKLLGQNPCSMGFWLPDIVLANSKHKFFKIPKTTVIKVPLTLLQLSRLDYQSLSKTTLDIVNKYCSYIFNLDLEKDYFIKTGIFSSKFDFRNARVIGPKEVSELGEYLLFITHQSVLLASPLNNITFYGAATTNEWVVREFIHDTENNPCIYNGLSLHTEYRVFVDFDTKKVIGITPYWNANVMKNNFASKKGTKAFHDYVVFSAYEDTLIKRYLENEEIIKMEVQKMLPYANNLKGQWSIDIMQNGKDFYLIDMALSNMSALNECIPKELKKEDTFDWASPANLFLK